MEKYLKHIEATVEQKTNALLNILEDLEGFSFSEADEILDLAKAGIRKYSIVKTQRDDDGRY